VSRRCSRIAACIASAWLALCLPAQGYAYETGNSGGGLRAAAGAQEALPALGTMQAAFAPWDDVEGLIVDALSGARREILMQAYLLTDKKIVAALRQAQQRGVEVKILLDAGQVAALPSAQQQQAALSGSGIAVWGETGYANAHNKVIVIDAASADAMLITGSYNFTWSAQHKNAENILIVRGNPRLAAVYAANWERHRRDAIPY
jgi:phosphatidylserine/phosphatidylglycerophosphate/cardiolipin synthase-like enzyme